MSTILQNRPSYGHQYDFDDPSEGQSEKLRFYLEKTLNQTQTDIALLLKFMYKRYLKYSNKEKHWFYFDPRKNKWIIYGRGTNPLHELMSKNVVNEYLYLSNYYTAQVSEILTNGLERSEGEDEEYDEIIINDYIAKSKLCSEICLKLTNKTFCNRVSTICEKLFENNDFQDLLDKRPHLIGFRNGVYDFTESRFRESYPEDLVSISIDYPYNQVVNELSYDPKIVDEIKEYFKTMVNDPEVLIQLFKSVLNGSVLGPMYIWLNYKSAKYKAPERDSIPPKSPPPEKETETEEQKIKPKILANQESEKAIESENLLKVLMGTEILVDEKQIKKELENDKDKDKDKAKEKEKAKDKEKEKEKENQIVKPDLPELYLDQFLEKVFEKYFSDLPAWVLRKRKIGPNAPLKELFSVVRKRVCLVIHDGTHSWDYNMSTIQSFIGHEKIEIRDVYRDPLMCQPQFRLILATEESDFKMGDLDGSKDLQKIEFKTDKSLNLNKKEQDKLLMKFDIWKQHFMNYLLSSD